MIFLIVPVSKRLHMSSETPAAGDAGAAAAPAKISKKEVNSDSSTWLDIIKEVIKVIKKCFGMAGSSSSSSSSGSFTTKSTKDYLTQLANILPTGTYLSFQVIAPLATNNAHCGVTEKIVTGVLLGLFAVIIAVSTFTDSVKIPSTGKVSKFLSKFQIFAKLQSNLSINLSEGSDIPNDILTRLGSKAPLHHVIKNHTIRLNAIF